MISFDTETCGVDFYHGARPFFLTTCTDKGVVRFWEWDVDPLTRMPRIPEGDLREFGEYLFADGPHGPIGDWEDGGGLVGHNLKFDFTAMASVGLWDGWDVDSAWASVHDTLIAGHLLFSNRPHDLTSMAIQYLGHDILPLEERLKEAVQKARNVARSHLPDWRIARDGLEEMPSARGEVWRADYWLPRAVCREARRLYSAWVKTPREPEPEPEGVTRKVRRRKPPPDPWFVEYARRGHPWETVLRDYANADSECTLLLWQAVRGQLRRRGLWEIYLERLKVLPVTYHMERRGITVSASRLEELKARAAEESEQSGRVMVGIASSYNYDLKLPKGGANESLMTFCFDVMGLEKLRNPKGKTDRPALDSKTAMPHYFATLPANSRQLRFVKSLAAKRARDTARTYLDGYRRFWLPFPGGKGGVGAGSGVGGGEAMYPHPFQSWGRVDGGDTFVLHPSFNVTGTDTLRMSCKNPNAQNVSAREDFSLRYCFGPAPGREWWSLDYENLELRLPAYASGEEAMIELFERPDEPPYFGSYHLLNASIVYPDLFWPLADVKGAFKDRHPGWYKSIKAFGFSVQYGAQAATADRAARRKGAWALVKEKLVKLSQLNERKIREANQYGYVETMPDRTVNPNRGYPLMCARTEYGKILPTVPLNYYVQGTACWIVLKAMNRCAEYLKVVNRTHEGGYHMVMNVHDELGFDFPNRGKKNLPVVNEIKRLMEMSGDDIGVPLKVSVNYHPHDWAKSEDVLHTSA